MAESLDWHFPFLLLVFFFLVFLGHLSFAFRFSLAASIMAEALISSFLFLLLLGSFDRVLLLPGSVELATTMAESFLGNFFAF
jgi:hypothetical protein